MSSRTPSSAGSGGDHRVARGTGPYKNPAKRQAILDAAAGLFAKLGFTTTSMGQVAQAAHVSKQTIYSHFRDKEHLFAEVVTMKLREYCVDRGHGRIAPAPETPDETPDASEALLAVGMAFARMAWEPDVVMVNRLIIAEARQQPEVAQMFYRNAVLRSIEVIAELLRSLRGHGLAADLDCEEAAWDLRNLWIGRYRDDMLFGRLGPLDEASLEAHVRRVNRLFLRLYGDTPTSPD